MGIYLSPSKGAQNKAVHVCGSIMEMWSLFIHEQINIPSGKRMMETETRNHEIAYSLPLLFCLKQKLTNWPFDISQFGFFSPKSSFQGPLGECFSLARLLWICSSAVSPGQTPSRSLLIGRQWVTCMHRLFFKTFSTPVTWPFYISPQTRWKCRCWEWEKGGMETTLNRCFEISEYFPNVFTVNVFQSC